MKLKYGRTAAFLLAGICAVSLSGCALHVDDMKRRLGSIVEDVTSGAFSGTQAGTSDAAAENSGAAAPAGNSAGPAAESAGESGSAGYVYSTLTDGAKRVYDDLYPQIMTHSQDVRVRADSEEDLTDALSAILPDHPEIFWMDGASTYSTNALHRYYDIHFEFNVDPSEIDGIENQINTAADAFIASIPADAGEYDKARLAYEYIVNNTEYVADSAQNQNIQSVFLYHESVCAGYAKAYKYLLDRAGIWCAYISGTIASSGVNHAWNLIRIGDTYTYVDPSWGDPTYGENAEDSRRLNIIYDYFCLTSSEMTRSGHVQSARYPAVQADENTYDYYRLNGFMYDALDAASMQQIFQDAVDSDVSVVYMKFTTFEAYARAVALVEEGADGPLHAPLQAKMRRDGSTSMQYYTSKSDELWIIKVYW